MQLMPPCEPACARIVGFPHTPIGHKRTSGSRRRRDAADGTRQGETPASMRVRGPPGRLCCVSAQMRRGGVLTGPSGVYRIRTFYVHPETPSDLRVWAAVLATVRAWDPDIASDRQRNSI